jgi:TolB protein
MTDLEEHFRALGRTAAPDMWEEAQTRPPRPLPPASRRGRVVAGITALVVGVAGFAIAVAAFDDRSSPPPTDESLAPEESSAPLAVANGPISFQHLGENGDNPGTIESIEPDGSDRRVLFDRESTDITQPAWSPDGARIAYRNPIPGERGIYVANADGSETLRLTDGDNDGWPSWSPDGSRIVFSSSAYDPSIAFCDGLPGQAFLCPTDIYAMDADGSNVERLTTEEAAEFQPAWAPDGERIAFVRAVGGSAEAPLIFSMGADGSEQRQISQLGGEFAGSDYGPTWSSDGSMIAFVGFRWEDAGLWVVHADGSGEQAIQEDGFAFAPWWANTPSWSPDGSLIAFACLPDEFAHQSSLCLIRPDGTGLERIADVPWETGDLAWRPRVSVESEPATVEVQIDTIDGIGPFPNAVVAGEGGVWVSAPSHDSTSAGEVVRLDPATGEIVARIPVEAPPTWEVGGGGIAVGLGRVWIVGSMWTSGTGHGVLQAIDAATNTVVREIDLGVGDGADVWVGEDGVWALVHGPGREHRIVRIDPATYEILATGDVPAVWSQTVFSAGGWIWVFGDDAAGREGIAPGTVYRIDPVTAQVLEQIELAETIWVPSTASEATWIRVEGGVQRFDPIAGALVGDPIAPDVGCCTLPFVADGSGGVWAASSADSGGPPSLRHVSADGHLVAIGPIDREDPAWEGVAYTFDPETLTIWVAHYRDAVSRIEIAPDSADV